MTATNPDLFPVPVLGDRSCGTLFTHDHIGQEVLPCIEENVLYNDCALGIRWRPSSESSKSCFTVGVTSTTSSTTPTSKDVSMRRTSNIICLTCHRLSSMRTLDAPYALLDVGHELSLNSALSS